MNYMHDYNIAERADGAWGVFCRACSDYARDYVYPCRERADTPPPRVLVAAQRDPQHPHGDACEDDSCQAEELEGMA